MSLEAWEFHNEVDNLARGLGYWTSHIGNGFLLYRFDEPRVLGEWFSTESEVRAFLAEIEASPRWRLPLGDNPIVKHYKYGVVVTDDAGRWFSAPAYRGDAYIYISGDQPTIGSWEQCPDLTKGPSPSVRSKQGEGK